MRQISATSYLFNYWACAVLDAIKKALVARFSALLCKTQCSKLWVLLTGLAYIANFIIISLSPSSAVEIHIGCNKRWFFKPWIGAGTSIKPPLLHYISLGIVDTHMNFVGLGVIHSVACDC